MRGGCSSGSFSCFFFWGGGAGLFSLASGLFPLVFIWMQNYAIIGASAEKMLIELLDNMKPSEINIQQNEETDIDSEIKRVRYTKQT